MKPGEIPINDQPLPFDPNVDDHVVIQLIRPNHTGPLPPQAIEIIHGPDGTVSHKALSMNHALMLLARTLDYHFNVMVSHEPQVNKIELARGPVMRG